MFKKYAMYLSFVFMISFVENSFAHYAQTIPNRESLITLEKITKLLPQSNEIILHKKYQFHMTLKTDFIFNNVKLNIFDWNNVYANVKDICNDIKGLISRITFKIIGAVPLGNDNNPVVALRLKPVLSIFTKIEKKEIKKQLLLLLQEPPHISIMKGSSELIIRDVESLVDDISTYLKEYNIFIQFDELKIIAKKNNRTLEFTF